jgi:hypothetical protein
MQTFLSYLINQELKQITHPNELQDYCYVFPTRRACKFFEEQLRKQFKGTYFWSPRTFSIIDFFTYLYEETFDSVVMEGTQAVFELFNSYKNHEPEANFDSFYAWGQLVLKDFDEVDRYMADTDALFANLKDIRDLDDVFALAPEQLSFIKQFWRVLDKDENTDIEKEFIRIWEVLGIVYKEFRANLQKNKAAYEGMAQRIVVDELLAKRLTIPFKRVVLGGFNALSTVEKCLIEHLTAHHNSKIYWDTDAYYMDNKRQEAGHYIRQYYDLWKNNPHHDWACQTNLLSAHKNLRVVGVPLKVGQAKYTGQLLRQIVDKQLFNMVDTAVVLGDESMLFPMLYSLPENIEKINITMGYPLRFTPLYQLLEALVQLHKTSELASATQPNAKTTYYAKFVVQIVNNPFIKVIAPQEIGKLLYSIEYNNSIRMYPDSIVKRFEDYKPQQEGATSIFEDLFEDINDTTRYVSPSMGIISVFEKVLKHLFNHLKQTNPTAILDNANAKINEDEEVALINEAIGEEQIGSKEDLLFDIENTEQTASAQNTEQKTNEGDEKEEEKTPPIEAEFIYEMLKQLRQLNGILRRYRQLVTLDTFWKLFREVVQGEKLQFTGEPVRGLQIMGFLETRVLDFKNLIILSVNEGNIPVGKPLNTFIPHSLRRAFGLPTFFEQDAIYAYHFYRLLQRAQNVYLLYNTEVGSLGSGEKSRFLLQLEYELQGQSLIDMRHKIVMAPLVVDIVPPKAISVEKNEEVIAKLDRFLTNTPKTEELPLKRLAPTALNTYINCPMQFYWKEIAQLYETKTIDEEINDRILGNVLHKTLELLYQPFMAYPITEKTIDKMMRNERLIQSNLNKAFDAENFTHHKEGRNLLLKKVIRRLVMKILEKDRTYAPFEIVGLEASEYTVDLPLPDGKVVGLKGTIDRIDRVTLPDQSQYYRILDYKSGRVDITTSVAGLAKDTETYLSKYFVDPKFKAGLQVYLYAYLFWNNQQRNVPVQAGLYVLREINKGILFLRDGEILSTEFFEAFEVQLQNLLSELFNYNYPFMQTENDVEKRYEYSPYKGLLV